MSKVIGIFDKKVENDKEIIEEKEEKIEASLEEAMKKYEENKERMRKERLQANKGVLKSYRIKN